MATTAIYTYGGGEALNLVFQGIAMTLGKGGILNSILKIAGSIGILWAATIAVIRGSINEAGRWFFWFILCINIFILPKGTVWIKDELNKGYYKIDNAPLVMGKIASIISTIGNGITKTMEQNFSVPDDVKYHKTGMVFASKIASLSSHFKVIDADFKENLYNFVNRCIIYDAMIGYKYTVNDLKTTDDIWGLVKSNASQALGMMYRYPKVINKESEIITCKEVAANLEQQWKHQSNLLAIKYGSRLGKNVKNDFKTYFSNSLTGTFNYLTGISKGAGDIIRQEMMINAIEEASNNKVVELGGSTNYATTKALLQQRSTYQITGELASRLLPAMKVVLEV
jgi:conjugal transfer mating pair stabilization protein TraG